MLELHLNDGGCGVRHESPSKQQACTHSEACINKTNVINDVVSKALVPSLLIVRSAVSADWIRNDFAIVGISFSTMPAEAE